MQEKSLENFLDKKTIIVDLKVNTKEEVIKVIAERFYEEGYIDSIKEFIGAVYEREKEGVTGIGNHVAIPHGKSNTVKRNGVAIAILDHEIEWDSLDDTGAKVVVLFDIGENSEGAKEHLKMLSVFARKLGKKEVIDYLLKAKSIDDVINAFKK
ncbi:fructose PTS transporter subunit IIA [Liquorilactobacillus mali]|uniref:PTS system fructose-specific IIA component n=1 Tax=Liquorilactobacillus mali TaxID=1618 RepID=A0A0R2FXN9_9LACO|nr:fructose PTS transporter subunit IIA [Liquorilactobacillus mali]KRN30076.1 PTS system fructose-specific IIA component [Liquorilactobacillus mali]MDN7144693.1 fructose PTS transporter subunit IIA [Liquorilactobacillus mali]